MTAVCSTVGVAVCSVVGDFRLPAVEVAVSELGVLSAVGFGFSVVGSAVAVGVDVVLEDVEPVAAEELSPETVVPEPPEALTVDVGLSPEVVVVVCELDDVVVVAVVDVDVAGSVPVDVVDVPGPPEVVVLEAVPPVEPVSVLVDGSEELPSSVAADATPWPLATAMPSPTANARPLARLARVGRFACLPRLAADKTCSRLPRVTVSWDPEAGT